MFCSAFCVFDLKKSNNNNNNKHVDMKEWFADRGQRLHLVVYERNDCFSPEQTSDVATHGGCERARFDVYAANRFARTCQSQRLEVPTQKTDK